MKGGILQMKFKNKRYITKGVNERVPLLTQLFMWHCIDTLDIPEDYLQVFKMLRLRRKTENYTHSGRA